MDTRERVARECFLDTYFGPDGFAAFKALSPDERRGYDDLAGRIMLIVDEDRAELVKALEPFATWRCEDPIRKEVVPTNYASHTLLHDCGKCDTCKARAAIAKATGK